MLQYRRFTVNFVQVNSYLIWDETRLACLVDPGFSTPAEQQIFDDFLTENELQLERCICSHKHFDHVLGGAFIKQRYGIDIEIPEVEITSLPDLSTQLATFGVPFDVAIFTFEETPLKGDSVTFGNTTFQILQTPGHSPGHISLYSPDHKVLFCGDVLFKNGMGRYDLWGASYEVLMDSIKNTLFRLPHETIVLSGHGLQTTIGAEKANFI